MAKKPTIVTVPNVPASINTNFKNLQDAFENTLSRNGEVPNSMEGDLDLNGNDILNVGGLSVDGTDYLTLLKGAVESAEEDAERAEMAADRVDLGALDAAVEATAEDRVQTGIDRGAAELAASNAADDKTAAELAKSQAESARDAAYINADVYADTAAGLAATTTGDQFQVVNGDEIIRYRHDAGPVATEVARYPSADAFFNRYQIVESIDAVIPEQGAVYLERKAPSPPTPAISSIVEIVAGTPRATVQQTLNDNPGKIIRLLGGTHRIGPIDVPANTVLEVTPLALVMWDLDYTLVNEDALFRVLGVDENNLIENVMIEVLGELDADSTGMSGAKSQLEGINFKRSNNCMVQGNGIVRNTSMDGIDFDASRNARVIGMTSIDCGGYGLHHGGSPSVPSDSIPNQNSMVIGFRAQGCGFTNSRGGIDINGLWGRVTLTNCIMIDNYRNYTFAGGGLTGRIVQGCQSIDTGSVTVQPDSGQHHTDYCQINNRLWLGGTEITAS